MLARKEFAKAVDGEEERQRFLGIIGEYGALAIKDFEAGKHPTLSLDSKNIERFINYQSACGGWTEATKKNKRQQLQSFLAFFGSRPLSLIMADDMAYWYHHVAGLPGKKRRYETAYSTLSVDTINKYLSTLRQFVRWARLVEMAARPNLPCELFTPHSKGKVFGNQRPPKALLLSQLIPIVKKLINRFPQIGVVIIAMFLLGARPKQLFDLTWGDLSAFTKQY